MSMLFVLALLAMAADAPQTVAEEITLDCPACDLAPPEDVYDYPLCGEMDLNDLLIEALERDDPSARAELAKRFTTSDTYRERHRIASALIDRVPNDRLYWEELTSHAQVVLRFPRVDSFEYTSEFRAWCKERGVDPDDHWNMALTALGYAGAHRRGVPLLLRGLESNDNDVILTAIYELAALHANDSLPAVERTLERLGEDGGMYINFLAGFESAEADAVAEKFLKTDDDRASYRDAKERLASDANR